MAKKLVDSYSEIKGRIRKQKELLDKLRDELSDDPSIKPLSKWEKQNKSQEARFAIRRIKALEEKLKNFGTSTTLLEVKYELEVMEEFKQNISIMGSKVYTAYFVGITHEDAMQLMKNKLENRGYKTITIQTIKTGI